MFFSYVFRNRNGGKRKEISKIFICLVGKKGNILFYFILFFLLKSRYVDCK